jgi:PAS domain S-box-containing protein
MRAAPHAIQDYEGVRLSPPGLVLPLEQVAYCRFVDWLTEQADEVIAEWVDRLTTLTPSYRTRPTAELYSTVSEAFRADLEALRDGRLERITSFIGYITQKRLQSGFPLSDVQKAFELFRSVVLEMMATPRLSPILPICLQPINDCLAFTLHRFSDLFQHMAERAIRSHAQGLERTVRLRTAELAESEQRYKTLVSEIDDGYFIVHGERVAFANQAFCRMHGSTLEEVVGRPFGDFVTPDHKVRVLDALCHARDISTVSGQLEYTRAGCPAEEAPTEMKYKVVDLGQTPVTIGICRDISQRVAMETQLRENERMAYVGHIAASLSHEIRNPLSTCTLNMMILKDKLSLDGFDGRRLEITVRELTRLEDILHQLLDMARPMKIDAAPIDLAQLARDCLDLMAARFTEAGVVVRKQGLRDLPLVSADFGKMEQALLNLLLNSMESLNPGGRLTVWTRMVGSGSGQMAELGVHDNGDGISRDTRQHLFTPFFTNKSRGTGLGLNIVKRIMEAHDGTVTVKGRQGVGVAFRLRLPWRQ